MSSVTMYPAGGAEPRQTNCRESSPRGGSARIGARDEPPGGVACADAEEVVKASATAALNGRSIRMTGSANVGWRARMVRVVMPKLYYSRRRIVTDDGRRFGIVAPAGISSPFLSRFQAP